MIGTIESVVSYDTAVTALTADVAVGAYTLPILDGADFGPGGGRLLLGANVVGYTAATETTISLIAPLTVAALEAATVHRVDVRDQPFAETQALVLLDEDTRAQPATVPSGLVAYFPLGTTLAGSLVEVELVGGLWRVVSQPDQDPLLDQSNIDGPAFSVRLATDQNIPTSVDRVLTQWEGEAGTSDNGGMFGGAPQGGGGWYQSSGREFSYTGTGQTGAFLLGTAGMHIMVATVRFQANTSGSRRLAVRASRYVNGVLTLVKDRETVATPTEAGGAQMQTVMLHIAEPGDLIQVLVWQGTGAGLNASQLTSSFDIYRAAQ